MQRYRLSACYFNPRTPCGVRRIVCKWGHSELKFQSTHPLRGATTDLLYPEIAAAFQSTHPLRGATDPPDGRELIQQISIHAPLAGCDFWRPTPCPDDRHFNPRTPCGVRHSHPAAARAALQFQSTHPLRGATCGYYRNPKYTIFQSTHPLRGATWQGWRIQKAPLHFNPRTPCGVRL